MAAVEAAVAATKSDRNTAIAALTSAALGLPGIQSNAAVPIAQPELNLQYGHYQESDNRMKVDVYHLDFVVPFVDRLELAFSIDRDTYSGATPAFSMPEIMTNQPKYALKTDGSSANQPIRADIISAASSGITPGGLTILGGLDTFVEFADRRVHNVQYISSEKERLNDDITEIYESGLSIADNEYQTGSQDVIDAFTTESEKINSVFNTELGDKSSNRTQDLLSINSVYESDLKPYKDNYEADKTNLTTQYEADLDIINSSFNILTETYNNNLIKSEQEYNAENSELDNQYNSSKKALDDLFNTSKGELDLSFSSDKTSLETIKDESLPNWLNLNPEPATISSNAIIDFQESAVAAYYGKANTSIGHCTANCYEEGGMVIGTPDDGNINAHIHQAETGYDNVNDISLWGMSYHADSSGIYIRALDGSAFSLESMNFNAKIQNGNRLSNTVATTSPNYWATPYWEILGFNKATNPGLSAGDGTNYASRVAYTQIANGFNGMVSQSYTGPTTQSNAKLDNGFSNVKSVWIHFAGFTATPTNGKQFSMTLDDVSVDQSDEFKDWTVSKETEIERISQDYTNNLHILEESYYGENGKLAVLTNTYNIDLNQITEPYNSAKATLTTNYNNNTAKLTEEYNQALANLPADNLEAITQLKAQYDSDLAGLTAKYNEDIAPLELKLNQDTLTIETKFAEDVSKLESQKTSDLTKIENEKNEAEALLKADYDSQLGKLTTEKTLSEKEATDYAQKLAKKLTIANYKTLLSKNSPKTPTVQRYQEQPLETRTMPTFSGKYYFDNTSLAFSGGYSDEADFLSNFGSVNLSHELNNKLTTVSAGYNISSNKITRSTDLGHNSADTHSHGEKDNSPDYANLNETSVFNGGSLGLSQVLSKNTLFQTTANYTNQSGYLSNPYKFVYIRGEVTAEEYYEIQQASSGKAIDWNSITKLQMIGTELFREVRPDQRNLFSLSNRINQFIPSLDASVHFDYRFYTDDWGINSHTLELAWYQSLPMGIMISPSIRYTSQSQADFFAPYFLAPREDGHYSSDFRLADFGALSSGISFSKQFSKGITLDAGFEYYTRQSDLKLGGGNDTSYADYNYYMVHAGLNVNLSAPRTKASEHQGHEMHHEHDAPLPAGVMYGHMMNTPGDLMVGYRYMYANQSGDIWHGANPINDTLLLHTACGNKECASRPSEMSMHMHMLDLMYAPTDWLNLMLMPQIMDMKMSLSNIPGSSIENEHGGGHNSGGLGDTIMAAMLKLFDMPGHHLHLGLGFSAPTGNVEVTMDGLDTPASELQDYGMQLGSGTWDFRPSLTYTGHLEDFSWGAQLSGIKRMQNKNSVGYALGDAFQSTAWGSYKVLSWLSTSVRGIYSEQGDIHGEFNRAHSVNSTVDYVGNYGGRFWDVGFGLNATIPEGPLAGHNLSFEWLQPVADDFNGFQLEREGSLNATWSFGF
jgi:hypothetical protein